MNDEVVGSMVEMISLMLTDFDKKEEEIQVRSVLQVIPFFQEIFSNLTPTSQKNQQLHKTSSTFLNDSNQCIKSIFNDKDDLNTFSSFFNQFILSPLAPYSAESVFHLFTKILSLTNIPNEKLSAFSTSFNSFFQIQSLRSEFIKREGLSSVWITYISDPENILIKLVFDLFIQNHKNFLVPNFAAQMNKFFSITSAGFSDLSSQNAQFLLQFFEKLTSKNINFFINHFDSNFGFNTIVNYILKHQEEDFYQYLEKLLYLYQVDSSSKNVVSNFVGVILRSESCGHLLRIRILNGFKDFIVKANLKKPLFNSTSIESILKAIPKDDIESILLLLSISFLLHVQTGYDLSKNIPDFLSFIHPEYLLKYDMSDLFHVLVLDPKQVLKSINILHEIIIEKQSLETFAALVNKYDDLFVLFVQHFGDNLEEDKKYTFIKYLILSFPHYKSLENAQSCLYKIVTSKEGLRFNNSVFENIEELAKSKIDISEFLNLLSVICVESKSFLQECINCKVQYRIISFHQKYGIPGETILDFLASIFQMQYIPALDRAISEGLKKYNFLDVNPDQLLLFALGLKQNQDKSKGSLCFPSLIGCCADYKFTDLYDLWLCGEVGVTAWMKNTNKPITEFPFIVETSCINMKLEQFEKIIEYPSLFCKVCEKIEKQASFFLFSSRDIAQYTLTIRPTFTKCVTFWIQFFEDELKCRKLTTLFRIGITEICIINNQIKIDSSFLCKVTPRTWIFVAINFNNNDTLTVSFNNTATRNFKPPIACPNSIIFGGKPSEYTWGIGGYLRIFNENLSSDKLSAIKNSGVCSLKYFNEYQQVVASLVADKNISPKVKRIVPYSLWNYIRNIKGSLEFIFKRAVDFLRDNKVDEAKSMALSLCYLTRKRIFNEDNRNFALYISTLFNIFPDVIDGDVFAEIINTFQVNSENGKFDWEGFLTMFSDNYWLFSNLRVKIISTLFNILSKYPIENETDRQSFIISLSCTMSSMEFDHSLNDSILELIELMNPDPQLILCLLSSYPHLLDNLSDLPDRYKIDENDRTINVFIQIFARTKCTKFTQYYLFSTLPSKDSVLLATALLQMKIENLETKYIIDNCINCSHIPEVWSNLLFLCTKRWYQLANYDVSKINTINLSNFDMNYIDSFIKMIATLISACFHMNENNFWPKLATALTKEFIKIIPSIPEKIIKQPQIRFPLLQLMTFGHQLNKAVLYPPIPQADSVTSLIPFLEMKWDQLKENESQTNVKDYEMENVELPQKPDVIPNLLKFIMSIIPKEVGIRGNSTYLINQDYLADMYNLYYANQTLIAKNWNEESRRLIEKFNGVSFENDDNLESYMKNPLYKSVVKILASFACYFEVLHPLLFNAMTIFPNDLYLDLRYQVIFDALIVCQGNRSYKPSLVNIACESALGCWFKSDYITIVESLFSVFSHFKENPPIIFYCVVLFGFDILQGEDLAKLMKIMSNNKNIFVNPTLLSNVDVTLAILWKMLSLISSLPLDTFVLFMKHFSNAINASEILIQYWGKNFPKIAIRNLLNPLQILSMGAIQKYLNWTKENAEQFQAIESILMEHFERTEKTINSSRIKAASSAIETRISNTDEFIDSSEKIILSLSHRLTFDSTTAATIQLIFKRIFVFKCLHSIRERELFISEVYPIKFNNSRKDFDEDKNQTYRKSISILSDPIYPTRRIEVSPLDYNMPEYPSGSVDDIMSTAIPDPSSALANNTSFPKCISDMFVYPCSQSKFLMSYSEHNIHLRFIQFLNVSPQQEMCLIQILLNNGKPFVFMAQSSILYGIDTLDGVFFVCDDSFIFIEGLKLLNKNEAVFESSDDFDALCFYSFLILSGYFGKPLLYRGHLVMKLQIDELIYFSQHYWIHKPYSFGLNFLRGYNFVLNLNSKKDFRALGTILKKAVGAFLDSAPPWSPVVSPSNSARLASSPVKEVANKWINGEISTYTYLCLLNRFGKRLTCDMTQYPVFPWIVSDYTSPKVSDFTDSSFRDLSLPIGQLNPERALHFDETYETSEGEYYYGSHYMHFGVVTYYLFRADPYSYESFIFHKGWDHPARMFFDVNNAWKTSIESSIDIKEIVPQFFSVPEIFRNISKFPLGKIPNSDQDTKDVNLPPWASNPRDFTMKMLRLLEDYRVSSKVNMWIDLIFGEKSRGQSAVLAKNVFPSYCYTKTPSHNFFEDVMAADDDDKDDEEVDDMLREANAIKIMNFGQCPLQLFTKSHPPIKSDVSQWSTVLTSSLWQLLKSDTFTLPPYQSYAGSSLYTQSVQSDHSAFLPSGQFIAIKSGKFIASKPGSNTNSFFSIDYDDPLNHHCSSPTVSVSSDGMLLCVGRQEGCLTLYRLSYTSRSDLKAISKIHMFDVGSSVNCTAVSSEHFIMFASSGKTIHMFDIGILREISETIELEFDIKRIEVDDISASFLVFGESEIAVCSISGEVLMTAETGDFEQMSLVDTKPPVGIADEFVENLNISLSSTSSSSSLRGSNTNIRSSSSVMVRNSSNMGSNPNLNNSSLSSNSTSSIKVSSSFSGGKKIDNSSAIKFDSPISTDSQENLCAKKRKITSVAIPKLPEHFNNRFFVVGFSDGSIDFWSVSFSDSENGTLVKLRSERISFDSILTIAISPNAQRLIAGTQKCIRHLEAHSSSLPPLKKDLYAVSCVCCNADIRKNALTCSRCGRFVCPKCSKKDPTTMKSSCYYEEPEHTEIVNANTL